MSKRGAILVVVVLVMFLCCLSASAGIIYVASKSNTTVTTSTPENTAPAATPANTTPAATPVVTTPAAAPVDCSLSWSDYGACDPVTKTQTSTATILTPAANGGTACPASFTRSQACTPPVTYVDFPNIDLNTTDQLSSRTSSLTDCKNLCIKNPLCVASEYNSSTGVCLQKKSIVPSGFSVVDPSTGVTLTITDPGTSSNDYVRASKFTGPNMIGGLTTGGALTTLSADQCRLLGKLSPGVAVASYLSNTGQCFLKSALGGSAYDTGYQSWLINR